MTKSIAVISLLLAYISGCIPLASLQDPEAVPQGVVRGGIGASWVGSYGPHLDGSARVGVFKQVDLSVKLAAISAGHKVYYTLFYGDLRAQALSEPVQLTWGMGMAKYALHSLQSDRDEFMSNSLQPFVSVGYRPVYASLRLFYTERAGLLKQASPDLQLRQHHWDIVSLTVGMVLPIGHSRLLLELNSMHVHNGRTILVPGLGIQSDI